MKLNLVFLVPALAFVVGASTNPTYGKDTEFSSLCQSIPACRTLTKQKEEEKRAEFDNHKEKKDEHKDEKKEKEEKEDREVSPN